MVRKNSTIKIVKNEEKPETTEIIAQSIIDVAAAAKKLLNSRLSKRAIILLIKDSSGNSLSNRDIEMVLDKAAQLEDIFIKKQPKK